MNRHDAYAVLRIPDFRNFVTARFLGVMAIQLQAVIVGWQVYGITHDPLSLGLVGLFEILPNISVSLFAGYIADRTSRRKIILSTFFVLTLCSIALLSCSTGIFPALHNNVYAIYSIIFASGLARGFLGASVGAFLAQLVPKELYHNSAAWNSTAWQTAAVSGPVLGGLLYGWSDRILIFTDSLTGLALYSSLQGNGAVIAYFTDFILMCLSLSFFSRTGEKPVPESDRKESMFESIGAGFSFVMKNEIVLGAMSLDMFAVLFGGAVAVLPIFASDILKAGPDGLGMLRAAPAVGAALMAVFLAYHPPKKNAGRALLFAVAGFGVTIVLFGISQNFLLSIFFLALSGAFDCISVVLRSTIMQTFTPDEMRGRVSSVNSIFIGSSNELGAFESGVAAKFLGTVTSVIFGGCMTVAIAAGVALRSPVLRRLDFTRSDTVSK